MFWQPSRWRVIILVIIVVTIVWQVIHITTIACYSKYG